MTDLVIKFRRRVDDDLDRRLSEIEDLAGAAALAGRDSLDVLDVRREIEEAEGRLAELIQECTDSLVGRLEANAEAVRRLDARLDDVAGVVEAIQAEMPVE